MRELNYFLASKKQRVKLPRKYRHKQELSQIPELAAMSVEPSTSVKSDLIFLTVLLVHHLVQTAHYKEISPYFFKFIGVYKNHSLLFKSTLLMALYSRNKW